MTLNDSVLFKIATAWQIFGDPELESPLMGQHILVGPLYVLIVSLSKRFASHGEVLNNMGGENVSLKLWCIT